MAKRMCKWCKKYVRDFIKVPAGVFCTIEHALEFAGKAQDKATRKRLAKVKADANKVVNAHLKQAQDLKRDSLKWQHKHTQTAFNKMRILEELLWFKERGLEPICISCYRPLGNDQWCCGHFKTRGAQAGLRYDRKNSFLQHNVRCNMHLSGDIYGTNKTIGYVAGLLERFGEVEGQAIIDYCETNTKPVKWEWRQLEEMRAEFRKRIKLLEQQLRG